MWGDLECGHSRQTNTADRGYHWRLCCCCGFFTACQQLSPRHRRQAVSRGVSIACRGEGPGAYHAAQHHSGPAPLETTQQWKARSGSGSLVGFGFGRLSSMPAIPCSSTAAATLAAVMPQRGEPKHKSGRRPSGACPSRHAPVAAPKSCSRG